MPNGGTHHCGHCQHYQEVRSRCKLRKVDIKSSHWTTCANYDQPGKNSSGPLYAIVCQVRNRAGGYAQIPYFDGIRADAIQEGDGGDTFICFTDEDGVDYRFPTATEYIEFYKKSGRQP